jgi:hypothetical protein
MTKGDAIASPFLCSKKFQNKNKLPFADYIIIGKNNPVIYIE